MTIVTVPRGLAVAITLQCRSLYILYSSYCDLFTFILNETESDVLQTEHKLVFQCIFYDLTSASMIK